MSSLTLPLIAILVITILLILANIFFQLPEEPPPAVSMATVEADSTAELESLFDQLGYRWPPDGPVPALALERMPPGMDELAIPRKKQLFFRAILPLVLAENRRIRQQREFVQRASDYAGLSGTERRRLQGLAEEYEVSGDLSDPEVHELLLRRVDSIPPALVLAQAAIESAWGASRFAREANNLFGIWTWDASRGILPRKREKDKKHLIRTYPNLRAAVQAYMSTLNTGHAYTGFRRERQAMRDRGQDLDALSLAGQLEKYSQRGADYVAEVRRIISGNSLTLANRLQLAG